LERGGTVFASGGLAALPHAASARLPSTTIMIIARLFVIVSVGDIGLRLAAF
jgi:hypothetical protein